MSLAGVPLTASSVEVLVGPEDEWLVALERYSAHPWSPCLLWKLWRALQAWS